MPGAVSRIERPTPAVPRFSTASARARASSTTAAVDGRTDTGKARYSIGTCAIASSSDEAASAPAVSCRNRSGTAATTCAASSDSTSTTTTASAHHRPVSEVGGDDGGAIEPTWWLDGACELGAADDDCV